MSDKRAPTKIHSIKVIRDSKGRIPWRHCPTLPGRMLQSQWLEELNITLEEFSEKSGIPLGELEELVYKKGDMNKALAEKLGSYLKTTAQFWMNVQKNVDDFRDQQREKEEASKLEKSSKVESKKEE